jgi:hypothetical protein
VTLNAPTKPSKPADKAANAPIERPAQRVFYPAAVAPPPGSKVPTEPLTGLVAHWKFDDGSALDSTGTHRPAVLRNSPDFVKGIYGGALHLDRKRGQAAVTEPPVPLDLKDQATIAGWINFSSIAPRWGSQILWRGDEQLGRDPLAMQLFTDGTLEFRSDRSITGKPKFVVWNNEIYLSPTGEKEQSQHVAVESPGKLQAKQWYFIAGTLEKVSPRTRAMTLYVNGDPVNQVKTEESVNYATDKMWFTIGGVDKGNWQNFDGLVDDLRVYNRALSPAEVKALYQQPWR